MEIIIFEKEAYYKMLAEIKNLIINEVLTACKKQNDPPDDQEWLNPAEAMRMLNIKSKTKMRELRDQGALVYSKFGRKTKYSHKSLIEFINKNIVK
jgi:hypothetical protein